VKTGLQKQNYPAHQDKELCDDVDFERSTGYIQGKFFLPIFLALLSCSTPNSFHIHHISASKEKTNMSNLQMESHNSEHDLVMCTDFKEIEHQAVISKST